MAMVKQKEDSGLQATASKAKEAASLLSLVQIDGRGRALVSSQPLRAGQIILRDSPILLYSALPLTTSPLQQQDKNFYCSNCFKIIQPSNPSVVPCHSCSPSPLGDATTLFCTPNCKAIAITSSHTPWVCQALIRLQNCASPLLLHHQDRQIQARFLVSAYNCALVSPSDFQTLLSLQGECLPHDDALFLHSIISSVCPPPTSEFVFSNELTAALLAKDKLNSFGLMEPFAENRERSVRAYGIYPKASFFNHDCLPNACRFDYVDTTVDNNTDIIIRVIHDVPEGREICLSYFPVNLKYYDRQQRLREDYGFTCECDRCKVEANWSDAEEILDDDNSNKEETMDEDSDEPMVDSDTEVGGEVEGENDFPHAYFFLRYMCDRNNCCGTLAPLALSDATPFTLMECNVCGNLKNHEEFVDVDPLE